MNGIRIPIQFSRPNNVTSKEIKNVRFIFYDISTAHSHLLRYFVSISKVIHAILTDKDTAFKRNRYTNITLLHIQSRHCSLGLV